MSEPSWAPFYTIHKIMAGMFDMYQLAGNQQALEVLARMAGWADDWSASKSEEHMQEILNTEYGGMNEALYNLAAATGNDRWAKAGDRFTKKRFFNPLALRRDELTGLHVNTHVPQVIGAARRYEISERHALPRCRRFLLVRSHHRAAPTSPAAPATAKAGTRRRAMLAAELKRSVATAECCCSYNMLKLTRHLYSWNADPRYFDYYERTLLNMRLGTIQPKTGQTQYYLSLTPGAWKTFNTEDKSFWCCTGTGVEEYSKLNDSIYWHDAGRPLRQSLHSLGAELDGEGIPAAAGHRFPRQPAHHLDHHAGKPRQPRDAPAHSGVGQSRRQREDQRQRARSSGRPPAAISRCIAPGRPAIASR